MRMTGVNIAQGEQVKLSFDTVEWSSIMSAINHVYGEDILGSRAYKNIKRRIGYVLPDEPIEKLCTALEQFIEDNDINKTYDNVSIERLQEFIFFLRMNKTIRIT